MLLNLGMQLKTVDHTQYWPKNSPNLNRRLKNEIIKNLQEEITREIDNTIIERAKRIANYE